MPHLEIPSPFGRLERIGSKERIYPWQEEWLNLHPPGRWANFPEWEIWREVMVSQMALARNRIWDHWEEKEQSPNSETLRSFMPVGLEEPGIPRPLPNLNEQWICVVATRMGSVLIESLPEVMQAYLESPTALIRAHMVGLDGFHPYSPATLTLLGDMEPLDWRQARWFGWGALHWQQLYRLWTPPNSSE